MPKDSGAPTAQVWGRRVYAAEQARGLQGKGPAGGRHGAGLADQDVWAPRAVQTEPETAGQVRAHERAGVCVCRVCPGGRACGGAGGGVEAVSVRAGPSPAEKPPQLP